MMYTEVALWLGHLILLRPPLPQQPTHAADADVVLRGKLPAGSTDLEGQDDLLYLRVVQPVGKPPLPETRSNGADAPFCGWLMTFKFLAELPGQLPQIMQQVATVQVGAQEADRTEAR